MDFWGSEIGQDIDFYQLNFAKIRYHKANKKVNLCKICFIFSVYYPLFYDVNLLHL